MTTKAQYLEERTEQNCYLEVILEAVPSIIFKQLKALYHAYIGRDIVLSLALLPFIPLFGS